MAFVISLLIILGTFHQGHATSSCAAVANSGQISYPALPKELLAETTAKEKTELEKIWQDYFELSDKADESSKERMKHKLELKLMQLGWKFELLSFELTRVHPSNRWKLPRHIEINDLLHIYELVSQAGLNSTSDAERKRKWDEIETYEQKYGIWVHRNSAWYRLNIVQPEQSQFPLASQSSLSGLSSHARDLLPPNAQVVEVEVKYLSDSERRSQQDAGQGEYVGIDTAAILSSRQRIRSAVEQFSENDKVKATLYLLAGSDAVLSRQLFPNSTLSVGVDSNPFVARHKIGRPIEFGQYDLSTYDRIDAVAGDASESLASAILGRFKKTYPSFRVRKVIQFSTPARRMIENPDDWRVHGLIEYDLGPGTLVAQHLQIQAYVDVQKDPAESWWYRWISQKVSWRALLLKASMSIFLQESPLRSELIDQLRRRQGFLIEDGSSKPSFSYQGPLSPHHVYVENIPFGYAAPGKSGSALVTYLGEKQ